MKIFSRESKLAEQQSIQLGVIMFDKKIAEGSGSSHDSLDANESFVTLRATEQVNVVVVSFFSHST
jgi:hypothetical protein